jgi:hypothetical protein
VISFQRPCRFMFQESSSTMRRRVDPSPVTHARAQSDSFSEGCFGGLGTGRHLCMTGWVTYEQAASILGCHVSNAPKLMRKGL